VIILFGCFFSASIFYAVASVPDLLPEVATTYAAEIMFVSLLSIYRGFAVIHNRLWSQYYRIMFSDLGYASIYLIGIWLLLEPGYGYIQTYFDVVQVALLSSILLARFNPLAYLSNTSYASIKQLLPIGLALMVYNFLETFFWGVDRIFIALYLEANELANFHIAHTFSRGAFMAYMAVTFLLTSRLMKQFSVIDDQEQYKDAVKKVWCLTARSELVLMVIVMLAILLIPPVVDFFMPKYSGIENLLLLVLLGLLLKGLCFYPGTFMISNNMQNVLVFYGIIFSTVSSLLYYFFENIMTGAIHYLSISVSVFLAYFIVLDSRIRDALTLNGLLASIKYHYKLVSIVLAVIFIANFGPVTGFLDDRYIFILILFLMYNKKIIDVIVNLMSFLLYRKRKYIDAIFLV